VGDQRQRGVIRAHDPVFVGASMAQVLLGVAGDALGQLGLEVHAQLRRRLGDRCPQTDAGHWRQEVAHFNAELSNLDTTYLDDTLHLTLTIRTSTPLRYEDVYQMQQDIALRLQKAVSVVVNQIFASKLDPLIPPTLTITPTFTSTPTPVMLTATSTFTPTSTLTSTLSPTPVPPTFTATPSVARITNTNGRLLDLLQSPGGPLIGSLRNGDYITVLYGSEVLDGLVWLQVMDKDGRIGWIPQINLSVVTMTPTVTEAP
jgi:hypothetical protein